MCFGQNNQTDNFPLDRDRLVDKAQPSPVAGQPVWYRVIIHVILINLYLAHIFWGEKLIDTPTSDIQNQFCKYYRRDRRGGGKLNFGNQPQGATPSFLIAEPAFWCLNIGKYVSTVDTCNLGEPLLI